jgi:hypothetical protein
MKRRTLAILTLGAAVAATGCLESGSAAGSQPAVRGVVDYDGPHRGPLTVAVFASFPPRGQPFAQQRFENPTFPQAYEIHGVPAGRYFVLAIVDADPGDGDRFNPTRDPGGAFGNFDSPVAVTIDPTLASSGVDFDLVDPSPRSPWAGAYR